MTEDTPYAPQADTRDLRDPQELGEDLLSLREAWAEKRKPLHIIADWQAKHGKHIPNYKSNDTLGVQAAREYRKELEGRDDIYAKSRLAGAEWDEPSID